MKTNKVAEQIVSDFYNGVGWEIEGNASEDARRWEDLRLHAQDYVSKCRLRVLAHIPGSGDNLLDMASGPVQYREYLQYSRNFKKRYCVDLSSKALEQARKRLGEHGEYLCGSFFDLPLNDNFFDCSVSLHTIYHMDKDKQEEAVRKLLRVTKPGRPVIIVYANPNNLLDLVVSPFLSVIKKLKGRRAGNSDGSDKVLYYHPHPLFWWKRFQDAADIRIFPWRSFKASYQKVLFPDNKLGEKMLDLLFRMEDKFPRFFVRFFQYPMVVLVKKQ